MLPASVRVTMLPSPPGRGYAHQNDAHREGGTRQRYPPTISVRHGQGEAQDFGGVCRYHGLSRGVVINRLKYRCLTKKPRGRRPDPFDVHWAQMLQCLEAQPDQTALELLIEFQARYPERYSSRHLRTLQRRLKVWRQEAVQRQPPSACLRAYAILNEVTPLGALTQCRDHLWNTLFDKNDILNIDYQTSQRTIQRKNAISDV